MNSPRFVFVLGFVACGIALTTAVLFFQEYLGLIPCPLCVIQRVIFISLGVVYLVAALHKPQGVMRTIYGVIVSLIALVGSGVSGWHVRLQNLPENEIPECGPGLEYMMEVMPLDKVLEKVFTGSGECSEVLWSLWGLSIPAWTFIAFLTFAFYGIWITLGRQ